jgi:hypothetical protein
MLVEGRWVDRGNIEGDPITLTITTGRVQGEEHQTEDTWGQTVTRQAERTCGIFIDQGTVTLTEEQSRSITESIRSHWETSVEISRESVISSRLGYK